MPKRRRPVNYDRQVVDYDSDDPLAAFRKRRKKGQKRKTAQSTTPPPLPPLRQAVREELVELKWRDQFWSRRHAPTQLNMFITRHEQLEAYIFKGHNAAELTTQRAHLHAIFTQAVSRINKLKHKLGVNYDRKLTFQLYQQIRHAQRRKRETIEDHCIDAKEASRWTRLLLIKYFPASLLGGPNQRRLIKRLALLFTRTRDSEIQLFYLTEVLKVSDFEWLKGINETIGCSIIARLANILINIVFVELRNAFYITENKSNQNQFYHKLEWRQLTEQHTRVMVSGKMLTPCDDKKEAANVRFIPSGNRFRLVMPFKPLLSKWDAPFTYHGQSMTIGKVIVQLLSHLVSHDGDERIVDVQTCEAMFMTLQSFLERHSERELHAIQCDVEKCYDRLSISAVFKHAQKQIVKFLDRNEFLLARRTNEESNWTFLGGQKPSSGDISLHRSLLMQWFDRARTMRVRYGAEQFNFNFMPHSLIVSRMAVCLYLHHLGRRILDKVELKQPLLLTRMVDDIIIVSTSATQCEQVYGRLKDKLTLNETKSQASVSIDPRLIKSFDHERPFQIAGCQISPDLKFIQPNAKAKTPLLTTNGSSSSAQLVPMIYFKCTGLVKFYTRNCLTPMHHDPARFMREFDAFIRRLFRLVARRLVAICRQLTPRQRESLPADIMARLVKFTKQRVRRQMVMNFTKTKFVSDAIKTQLKNCIDPMVKKSCLEELKRVYLKEKPMLRHMSGLGQVKKFKLKKKFNADWQLVEWSKVNSKSFGKPHRSKSELCNDTSLTL